MKYLGVFFNCHGVDYIKELENKKSKLQFAQSKLPNTLTANLFHCKSLYANDVIESILSYGLSLWDPTQLVLLEKVRKSSICRLFGNTRLIHEYICYCILQINSI